MKKEKLNETSERAENSVRIIEANDPSQVQEAVKKYVAALAETLHPLSDTHEDLPNPSSIEHLTTLLRALLSAPELHLAVRAWGGRPSLAISSKSELEAKYGLPLSRSGQLKLLLEAAARHRAVASGLDGGHEISNAVLRLRANAIAKKLEKEAIALIAGSKKAEKTKSVLQAASILALAAAACGTVVSPTIEGNGNQPLATATSNTPEITETPTEAPPATPESLTRQETLLRQAGYQIEATEQGVSLVNREGQPVLKSTEAATVTITTENGETLIFPQDDFEVRKTIGAGMENLLTVKNPEGNVEYFYLERVGYWATPLEWFSNPKEIENYPAIELQDVWNGRMAQTAAINAEPFPEGTLVPKGFVYTIWAASGPEYFVTLGGIYSHPENPNGVIDHGGRYLEDLLRQDNDPQRWVAFYQTITPEGREAVIGIQQVMAPNNSSLFIPFIFGPEWPIDEDYPNYQNTKINLVTSVFLGKSIPTIDRGGRTPDNFVAIGLLPVIYTEYGDYPTRTMFGVFRGSDAKPSAGEELSQLTQNNLALVHSELLIRIHEAGSHLEGRVDIIGGAGDEVLDLQYMALNGWWAIAINPEYFQNAQ